MQLSSRTIRYTIALVWASTMCRLWRPLECTTREVIQSSGARTLAEMNTQCQWKRIHNEISVSKGVVIKSGSQDATLSTIYQYPIIFMTLPIWRITSHPRSHRYICATASTPSLLPIITALNLLMWCWPQYAHWTGSSYMFQPRVLATCPATWSRGGQSSLRPAFSPSQSHPPDSMLHSPNFAVNSTS